MYAHSGRFTLETCQNLLSMVKLSMIVSHNDGSFVRQGKQFHEYKFKYTQIDATVCCALPGAQWWPRLLAGRCRATGNIECS